MASKTGLSLRALLDEGAARLAEAAGVGSPRREAHRLWADTVIDAEHWTWLEPIEIEKGDSIRLNLSTGNVDDNPFRCKAPG